MTGLRHRVKPVDSPVSEEKDATEPYKDDIEDASKDDSNDNNVIA